MFPLTTFFAQAAETAIQTNLPESGAGQFWVFWILAPLSIATALAVVLLRRPVHSALMLVINFFCVAVFYFALGGQFLGTMQITVYAGAVVILFLFVIMLLGIESEGAKMDYKSPSTIIAGVGSLVLFAVLSGVFFTPWMSSASACNTSSQVVEAAKANPSLACVGLPIDQGVVLHQIGLSLFGQYLWAFEVMAVLLTVAAVGALIIGRHREDPQSLVEEGYAVEAGKPIPYSFEEDELRDSDEREEASSIRSFDEYGEGEDVEGLISSNEESER